VDCDNIVTAVTLLRKACRDSSDELARVSEKLHSAASVWNVDSKALGAVKKRGIELRDERLLHADISSLLAASFRALQKDKDAGVVRLGELVAGYREQLNSLMAIITNCEGIGVPKR
jgi:hypothetical protein